jgi:hypothetical protein
VLQRIGELEKQAAIAHDFVSRGKSLQNLSLAMFWLSPISTGGRTDSRRGDIHERLIFVVPKHRGIGHGNGVRDRFRPSP